MPVCPVSRVIGILKTRTDNKLPIVTDGFEKRPETLPKILPAVDGDDDLGGLCIR